MIYSVYKNLCGLLGTVDISAGICCRKAYLTCFTVCDVIAIFIYQCDVKIELRLSDRSGFIWFVKLCDCNNKTTLTHSIYIKYRKIGSI